jgi:hypothetical protein
MSARLGTIEKFADFVNRAGYASPIRTPRGRDILAACGQLKSAGMMISALIGGTFGGLTYWAAAGKNAGNWISTASAK